MPYRLRFAMFALAAFTSLPAIAQAGATPVTAPGDAMPDPERLVLAQQVIAIVLPPDQSDAIVTRILDAIIKPMTANAGAKFDRDPGLKRIWDNFRDEVSATARESVRNMIPQMREVYSVAYARHFTRDELSQILAFGKTPTGAKYLSRASELMQDDGIRALMMRSMSATTARMQPAVEEFKVKIRAYLAAHPDAAKSLAQ